MVIEVKGVSAPEEEIEKLATKVFFKAIDLLGGLSKLAEFRSLTWLPALARASLAVVMKEEYMKTEKEIAERLGMGTVSVRNMLRADSNAAMEKVRNIAEMAEDERKSLKVHTAGGIAKVAFKIVKEESDSFI